MIWWVFAYSPAEGGPARGEARYATYPGLLLSILARPADLISALHQRNTRAVGSFTPPHPFGVRRGWGQSAVMRVALMTPTMTRATFVGSASVTLVPSYWYCVRVNFPV